MNEETTQAPVEKEQPQEAEQPTLDALYNEYNIKEQQATAAQPASEPVTQPVVEPQPDQIDLAAIQQELQMIRQERAAASEQSRIAGEEADFNNAVAAVGEQAGLSGENGLDQGKQLMVKGYLIALANEDPRLRMLWDNRKKNPDAWEKAIGILGSSIKKEFDLPNPQLVENQRAMDESQKGFTTEAPQRQSAEQQVLQLNEADFTRMWQKLARRG